MNSPIAMPNGPGLPTFPITQIYYDEFIVGSFKHAEFEVEISLAAQGYWCQALNFGILALSTTRNGKTSSAASQDKMIERFHKQIIELMPKNITEQFHCIRGSDVNPRIGTSGFIDALLEKKHNFAIAIKAFVDRMNIEMPNISIEGDPGDGEDESDRERELNGV